MNLSPGSLVLPTLPQKRPAGSEITQPDGSIGGEEEEESFVMQDDDDSSSSVGGMMERDDDSCVFEEADCTGSDTDSSGSDDDSWVHNVSASYSDNELYSDDEILQSHTNILCVDPRILPLTKNPIAASEAEGRAPFGENLWWPESADHSNRQYLLDFFEYCQDTYQNTMPLQGLLRICTELLCVIVTKRIPFCMYKVMYAWHLRSCMDTRQMISRKKVTAILESRYFRANSKPKIRVVKVPGHPDGEISIVCHNFEAQLVSLLSDPRIKPEDYLFFEGDPRKNVPDNLEYVGDLNTGASYRAAEKAFINDPTRQKLCPLLFYLDGATITNCNGLTMCALKFTLGIFNSATRDKPYAYRELGYMVSIPKPQRKGAQLQLEESLHIDAAEFFPDKLNPTPAGDPTAAFDTKRGDASEEDDEEEDYEETNEKAQYFHSMMNVLLEDVRKYMSDGCKNIVWLLAGKYLMELVFYVELVKGDSAESDKHCGKYQVRTGNVKHLCRYCHVPNGETDDPYANFAPKTKEGIKKLVDKKDLDALKAISQHLIHNCWYKVRFSPQCPGSIHECSPLDILHWLQINKYTYIVDCFYKQAGEQSQLMLDLLATAAAMGPLFHRQSDSAAERTNFQKGLKPAGLTAHMRTGVMLVLLTVLRSSRGRKILKLHSARSAKYRENFGTDAKILDWITLIEQYLTMEAWLRQPKLLVSDVEHLRLKIRKIMSHEKQVCKRTRGMQFRTFNFHAATHIPDQILNFGVMSGFNCESNEHHHKDDKSDALKTQKRESNFEIQLGTNIHLRTTLEYAELEIKKGTTVHGFFEREWKLPDENKSDDGQLSKKNKFKLGGLPWTFSYKNEETGEYYVNLKKCPKHRRQASRPHKELVEYLDICLSEWIGKGIRELHMYTEATVNGRTYRASPHYKGGPWRDWVMAVVPDKGLIPCHIWAFLDMRRSPLESGVSPGMYMIVETTRKSPWPKERNLGNMFQAYVKDTATTILADRTFRHYEMVNIKCIEEPAIVIPDFANAASNTCLLLERKCYWAEMFQNWLRS